MKRRTHPEPTKGFAPYTRYNKAAYQYPPWARAECKGGYTPATILKECRALIPTRSHRPTDLA